MNNKSRIRPNVFYFFIGNDAYKSGFNHKRKAAFVSHTKAV